MFVVLFEVRPKEAEWDRYLELAASLRPDLTRIPGFIDNERYASEATEGKVLSLSTWESEKALVRWRTHGRHHKVQEQGRFEVFADYHLRVCEVTHDSATSGLAQQRLDATEVGHPAAAVVEVEPGAEAAEPDAAGGDLVASEWYSGISTEGKRLLLSTWRSIEAAEASVAAPHTGGRQRVVRVIRDYGMYDRRETPQYYPDVAKSP